MLSRRKLYTTAIEILRRELRPLHRILHKLRPRQPPCRVSWQQSLLNEDSQCFHRILPFSRCKVRLWSPYSTGSGNGVTCVCWNCSEPSPLVGPFLSCGACRAVQPVDLSVDYFQIFGLEQEFDLNDENLEGKYKEWQKKLHPDLFHTKSEKEKTCAVEQSARVIDAYRTLSKPLSRALYLMMDVREAIEEASDPKALMEIQHQIQRRHEDWSNSFREAFNKRDFDSALSATEKMRYYERAIEEIVKKL